MCDIKDARTARGSLTMAAIEDTFEPEPLKRRAAFVSRRRIIITFLVITVLLVGGLAAYRLRGSPVDRGSRALIDAFSSRRLIEPRLSGGFLGGEFRPSLADRSNIDWEKLATAGELIRDSLAKGDLSAQLPYARLLLLSEDQKLPEALKYLRRAVAGAPENAEAHNDLGVCLIQQDRLEEAIDEFQTALEHKSDMPEALFNRSLCYRRLRLRDAADTDLGRFMEIEHEKGWLADAKRQRDELSATVESKPPEEIIQDLNNALVEDVGHAREIVDQSYDVVRKYFYFALAQQYLQSEDTSEVDLARSRIDKIGHLSAEVKGDYDIADAAKQLLATSSNDRPDELKHFKAYEAAMVLLSQRKYDEAQLSLKQLEKAFQKQGNSLFTAKIEYDIAQSLYQSRHFTESIAILNRILPLLEANRWRYHQAHSFDLLGLNWSRLGQDSKALNYFQQGYQLFQEMHEPVATPLQFVGMTYWHLGDFEKALEHFHTSTGLFLNQASNSGDLAYNYLNVADVYRLLDRGRLALLFADEALKYSNKGKDMNRTAQASSFQAVEHAHLGDFDLAAEEIKEAIEKLEGLGAADRSYTEPLVLVRAGEVALRRGDITTARQHYTMAESLTSRAEGDPILHINALRGRADAYARAGQHDQARKDLEKAIKIVEGYRENLIERIHRMEFLGASQSVFDQMILLDVDQPENASEAFEMSERSRARGLLDEFAPKGVDAQPAKPLNLVQIQAALPDNVTLLVYSVTSERTHMFLITHSGFRIATSPATARELDRMVNDYVSAIRIRAPINELSQRAHTLYQLLVEPVRKWLNSNIELCIVPDKSLQLLPMAALKDSSDQYLVESFPLLFAPSASVFIRCLNEARKFRSEERFLAVGDPAFNKARFPNLPSLDDARVETQDSSSFYSSPTVLTGTRASEGDVREAMKYCNVAHLAVHCLVNQQSVWRSALLLAPQHGSPKLSFNEKVKNQPDAPAEEAKAYVYASARAPISFMPETPVDDPGDGLLYLNEVYNLELPATRLIVLSACETGLGPYYGGEGIVSLIHPFLAARVSTVVASLWPVESGATRDLMISFHQERRTSGRRAADALRSAQLKMIIDSAHPYDWASFIVVGGNY